jgi:ferredoxin
MLRVDTLKSLNLLGHAQIEELEVGSRCGGHGECGGDRIRIVSGMEVLSPLTDAERRLLTQGDLQQGYRLACQCFPESEDAQVQVEVGQGFR